MKDGSAPPPLQNDLILRAARGERVEQVPVWLMRQAGRYLPEFKEVFSAHDFFTICRTPALCCKLTLQPVERFNLDAAIMFSDILMIPQALGMECVLKAGVGPCFSKPLTCKEDVTSLKPVSSLSNDLECVYEAIRLTRHGLQGKVPLIGFAGAPWTLFCYMIEGAPSKTCAKAKRWLYTEREMSDGLLHTLSDAVVEHLVKQVEAGCQMLQVFESNAELLTMEQFRSVSVPLLRDIAAKVKSALNERGLDQVPLSVYAKGAHHSLQVLASLGYDVVSVDWCIDPTIARDFIDCTIQGNLDPCALYAKPEDLSKLTVDMLEKFGVRRFIANLGHGVYPDTDPEHVACFIDTVHSHSKLMMTGEGDTCTLYT